MNLKELQYRYGLNKAVINLIVWSHSLFIYFFDALLLLMPGNLAEGERKKILAIKLDAIGDFILWLDFAKGLRELYPQSSHEITLLANQACAGLAAETGFFDRILPVDRMRMLLNPAYRMRTMRHIRRQGFEVVIDPAYSREFQFSPAVARVSGARERYAPQGDAGIQRRWQKKISDRWYTRLFPSSPGELMELRRNAEFLRAIGHNDFKARLPVYRPRKQASLSSRGAYYVIFPGAGWVNRQWPIDKFAALADLVYSATGWVGVICGGPGEESLAGQLRQLADTPLEDKVGKTTLDELAAIIGGARFVMGNETSAIHLAAAVSTPAVCILGGGHYGRFLPYVPEEDSNDGPLPLVACHRMECYFCNWHCIYPLQGAQPVPCIDLIETEEVWEKVLQVVGKTNPCGFGLAVQNSRTMRRMLCKE